MFTNILWWIGILFLGSYVNCSGPKIVGPSEHVIATGQNLTLVCQGDGPLSWTWPDFSSFEIPQEASFSVITETSSQEISTLQVYGAHYLNTGYYICKNSVNEDKVYVYVEDPNHLLAVNDTVMALFHLQGDKVIIPCKPTSPNVSVELYRIDDGTTLDDYNPEEGFTLHGVTVLHSSTLLCKAKLGEEEQTTDFHLMVNPTTEIIPKPHIDPSSLKNIQVGNNATILCKLQAEEGEIFNMEWALPDPGLFQTGRFKVGTMSKQSHHEHQYKTWQLPLYIWNVSKSDQGDYICTLRDARQNSNEQRAFLKVYNLNETSINMSVYSSQIELFATEKLAKFVVKIDAHPPADITWLNPEGKDLSKVTNSKYKIQTTDSYTSLEISPVTIMDFGNYTVIAENSGGKRSLVQKLIVHDEPKMHIADQPYFHLFNTTAKLSCRVWGYPLPDVEWKYKKCDFLNQACDDVRETEINKQHSKISELQINEYSLESTFEKQITEPGEVTCYDPSRPEESSDTIEIRVTDVPNGFSLTYPDEIVNGIPVTFSCAVATYNYTDSINWYFSPVNEEKRLLSSDSNMVITKDNGIYSYWSTLKIINVSKNHTGTYSCKVDKIDQDFTEETFPVNVLDLKPPILYNTNLNGSEVEISSWQPIEWYCAAAGVPAPTIVWFKDDIPIIVTTNASNYELSDRNRTLLLKSVTSNDEGNYSCRAFNLGGVTEATITLKLKGVASVNRTLILTIIVIALLFVIITILLVYTTWKERKRKKAMSLAGLANFKKGAIESINPDLTVDEQSDLLPYPTRWEFPRKKLKLGKQLGSGAFGVVLKAEAEGILLQEKTTVVAVKMVKRHADPAYIKALAGELKIMVHLGKHVNVVNLLGACTQEIAKGELLVIVEFCKYGNLQQFLLHKRSEFIDQIDPVTGLIDVTKGRRINNRNSVENENCAVSNETQSTLLQTHSAGEEICLISNGFTPEWSAMMQGDYKPLEISETIVSTSQLVCWSFQIARGMEYLASRKVLHGDLAARNILLAEGNIIKICDFGFAKSIYNNGEYKKSGDGPLPLKWMSIEAIQDRIFSTQSDVWSFGVVLWELFSLARSPYPGIEKFRNILMKLLEGYRMEKPEFSTQRLYEIMLSCWRADPQKRPSFTDLACQLGVMLDDSVREHYIGLNDEYKDMRSSLDTEDYLAMMRSPTFDGKSMPAYVNVGNVDSSSGEKSPPWTPTSDNVGDRYELKPMLPNTEDDYLTPREIPFQPSPNVAVSNPGYLSTNAVIVPTTNPSETEERQVLSKDYGKIKKPSRRRPVKDNIYFFESFFKRDNKDLSPA